MSRGDGRIVLRESREANDVSPDVSDVEPERDVRVGPDVAQLRLPGLAVHQQGLVVA